MILRLSSYASGFSLLAYGVFKIWLFPDKTGLKESKLLKDEASDSMPEEITLFQKPIQKITPPDYLQSLKTRVQIFISYAREDAPQIAILYECLVQAGFDPWLDTQRIKGGQKWEPAIKKALKESDFVLVCLSSFSINKRGFLQREIKQALEQAEEKLEEDVYLIPARLDNCEVPETLKHIQWINLFDKYGWENLLSAFEYGLKQLKKT